MTGTAGCLMFGRKGGVQRVILREGWPLLPREAHKCRVHVRSGGGAGASKLVTSDGPMGDGSRVDADADRGMTLMMSREMADATGALECIMNGAKA